MDKHKLLHPPLPVKNLKNKDEVLFINQIINGKFEFVFLDARFKYLPKRMEVPVNDISKFLDSVQFQNLKAVMFHLFDRDDNNVNLEIRQMVYEEVRKRKWHIYLVNSETFSTMLMLFSSKIDSKPGDVIFCVLCADDQTVGIFELQHKQEGYSFISERNIKIYNKIVNDVAAEILGTCNPKYVIVCAPHGYDLAMSLKSLVVPSKNVISIYAEDNGHFVLPVLKTIYDHGYSQIIPFTMDTLAVTNESNITDPEQAAIVVDEYEELPLEKIKLVPKSNKPYYVAYLDETPSTYRPAGQAQISKEHEGHRIKLALVVDRNSSLPFLYQESFILPEIEALPQKLASHPDLNVPVVGFYDNSSVICVRDENGYMFLNGWNGLYGNDLYLCFEQKEPTMITDLYKVNDKDPFIVYDLIKILSIPPNGLKADPNWGFKVTCDAENPVLLEHDTFLGIRKATPVFLMALLLKHHIKVIKNEIGKKPKELGFCLFNEFTNEEKNRIHTGLEEACKLLKIGFVFVSSV